MSAARGMTRTGERTGEGAPAAPGVAALAQVQVSFAGLAGALAGLEAALRSGAEGDWAGVAEAWWRDRQRRWIVRHRFLTNDLVQLTGTTLEVNSVPIKLRGPREVALMRALVMEARRGSGRFLLVDELAQALRVTAEAAAAVQRAVSDVRLKLEGAGLSPGLIETSQGKDGLGYRLSTAPMNLEPEAGE